MRVFLFIAVLLVGAAGARADKLPIFDAHVHYSHDAVELIPPKQVAALLRKAGVRRALVSSSDDNGTQLEVEPPLTLYSRLVCQESHLNVRFDMHRV